MLRITRLSMVNAFKLKAKEIMQTLLILSPLQYV